MHTLVTPPERQNSFTLADGRQLAWSEWGPMDGQPVVFCTGAGLAGCLGFGADCLAELGLRLLAIDRPGLGASSSHPDKTLLSWAADMREWVQAQGLQRVVAVGFSQGAPFALALADQGLVAAIAIVAGQDELAHPALHGLLHHDVLAMVNQASHDPMAFERRFTQVATAEGMWELIMGMSGESDRAIYSQPDVQAGLQQALQAGFCQGAQGYARDLTNAILPWPFALESISVPVDLWYGHLDTSPVHSPDFGHTLATRLPNATHTLIPDAGAAILWTRSRQILSQLIAHVD